jgi:spore maturation protein CgeB
MERGHNVRIYEPRGGWSLSNLVASHGVGPIASFRRAYPQLNSRSYDPRTIDLERELDGADMVLVHEWNEPSLVRKVGEHRARSRHFKLFFHDTHHRAVSDDDPNMRHDLRYYDGVLAFGRTLRDLYITHGWVERAWTWHEAADTRVFRPLFCPDRVGDLVWIGNWGDEERSAALKTLLIRPIREEALKASFYGVRYPENALREIREAGIRYEGWVPNFEVPCIFARFKVTVHIPRSYYVDALPGIPTIRIFEALACGIPLICAPWEDAEGLFHPGLDFLVASDAEDMKRKCRQVLNDPSVADELRGHGLRTIRARHTCAHRVDELLNIYAGLNGTSSTGAQGVENEIQPN